MRGVDPTIGPRRLCSSVQRPRRAGRPWPPSREFAAAMNSAAAGFRARSLARRRSGVRFIRFSFQDLFEVSWREPQPATDGASPTCSRWVENVLHWSARTSKPRPGSHPGRGATDQFLDATDRLLSVLTSGNRILARMHPGYCPQCGERVTPYAAGCALCGADLDPKRWQKPVSVRQRLSIRMPAGLRRTIRGRDAVRVRDSF